MKIDVADSPSHILSAVKAEPSSCSMCSMNTGVQKFSLVKYKFKTKTKFYKARSWCPRALTCPR